MSTIEGLSTDGLLPGQEVKLAAHHKMGKIVPITGKVSNRVGRVIVELNPEDSFVYDTPAWVVKAPA